MSIARALETESARTQTPSTPANHMPTQTLDVLGDMDETAVACFGDNLLSTGSESWKLFSADRTLISTSWALQGATMQGDAHLSVNSNAMDSAAMHLAGPINDDLSDLPEPTWGQAVGGLFR